MLKIKKPVIIIGCPRSGTSLLFRILSTSSYLWSLYRESEDIWNKFYRITQKEFKDEVLTERDLDEETKTILLNEFHKHSLNTYNFGYITREYLLKKKELNTVVDLITSVNLFYKNLFAREYRIIEKTPKNCFRISFINKLFDDCKFIFLKRDGRSNINSLIEGWQLPGRYIRGQVGDVQLNIKGYSDKGGKAWKYVLPPDWKDFTSRSLEEVCAFQWVSSNKAALEGLKSIEEKRKITVRYEDLSENTYETVKKICDFINIPFSSELRNISKNPPMVNFVTKPKKDKWKKNVDIIKNTYPMIEPIMKELGYSLDDGAEIKSRTIK